MSILKVNEIRSQTGSQITIPAGYELSVQGTVLSSSSLPPNPSGNAGKFLKSTGSALTWENVGPTGISVFTSNGTWNRPTGVTKILVKIVGGGGAGSGVGETGAAGGYAERLMDVTSISSVNVTVGLGSTSPTYYAGSAGSGNSTSFGSYLTATAGRGGNQSHQHCGGLPGVGSGGDLNLYGGGGSGHMYWSGPPGGNSYFGGAGTTGHPQGGNYAHNHSTHAAYGCGGPAGYHTTHLGANGMNGVVVVYEFK